MSAVFRTTQTLVDQGYSTDYAEADEGIHGVAAPLFETPERVEKING
ncbi:MAG: hypothetical protein AAF492_02995 [Verrucomicrobiota bacterium]